MNCNIDLSHLLQNSDLNSCSVALWKRCMFNDDKNYKKTFRPCLSPNATNFSYFPQIVIYCSRFSHVDIIIKEHQGTNHESMMVYKYFSDGMGGLVRDPRIRTDDTDVFNCTSVSVFRKDISQFIRLINVNLNKWIRRMIRRMCGYNLIMKNRRIPEIIVDIIIQYV